MANILNLITIGEKKYLVLDGDPSLSGGVSAEVGSLAVWEDGSNVGRAFVKIGASDTDWDKVSIDGEVLRLDGTNTMTGNLDMGQQNIDNVQQVNFDGTVDQANINFNSSEVGANLQVLVENAAADASLSLDAKGSVIASSLDSLGATQASITLSNDGIIQTSASDTLKLYGTNLVEFGLNITSMQIDGDGLSMFSPIDMTGFHKIKNLADGTDPGDAVNKSQLDAVVSGSVSDDAYGAGWNGVTTIAPSKNAVYDELETLVKLNGTRAMTGALNMNSHLINNVLDPVSAQDAATKNYIDNGFLPLAGGTLTGNLTVGGDLQVNGTLTYLNSTNTEITDKLILLNKGGAAASAGGSGIEFEENALVAGYLKVEAAREGFEFKAPAIASALTLDLGELSAARTLSAPNESGIAVIRGSSDAGVQYQVPVYDSANRITSSASLMFDPSGGPGGAASLSVGDTGNAYLYLAPSGNAQIVSNNLDIAPSSDLNLQVGGSLYVNPSSGLYFSTLVGPNKFIKVDALGLASADQINLTSDITGILPIANGGTNSSTALNSNRIMISSAGAIVEHSAQTQGHVAYYNSSGLPTGTTEFFWDNANARLGINVAGVPTDSLHVDGSVRFEDLVGPNKFLKVDASGVLSADQVTLTSDVSGILPIANGGTNSSTALSNNRMMISSAGAIVEHSAQTAGHVSFYDGSGLISGSSEFFWDNVNGRLGINVAGSPATSLHVDGDIRFEDLVGPNKFLKVDASGNLSADQVTLTSDVTGILPVANGGTNSSTALSNNRMMISSAGAIVEHSALTQGQIMYPDSSGLASGSADLFWDASNARLGIGTNAPARALDVDGSSIFRGALKLLDAVSTKANFEILQEEVSTTDATVTEIASVAVPTDKAVLVEARIVGRRTGGVAGAAGDAAVYVRSARFKNVGGTVTIHNLQSDYTSEDQPLWNGTIVVNGTNASIRINGAANTNVDWTVTYFVVEL